MACLGGNIDTDDFVVYEFDTFGLAAQKGSNPGLIEMEGVFKRSRAYNTFVLIETVGTFLAFHQFTEQMNVWNIGAEGQLILGAVFSGWVALTFPDLPVYLMMPAMIIAAMIGGLLWAMIPALLKVRFNTNEILVSLMLTYVGALFIDWLVRGPWRDPMSFGFPPDQNV